MRRRRPLLFVLGVGVALAIGATTSCSAFTGEESPASDEAGTVETGAPSEDSATARDSSSPDDARTPPPGAFCVDGGPYDRCWDFTETNALAQFTANYGGQYEAFRDTVIFASPPAAFRSVIRMHTSQSFARIIHKLGPVKSGTYTIGIGTRLNCPATVSARPSILELYCAYPSTQNNGALLRVVVQGPNVLRIDALSNGDGGPFQTFTPTQQIPFPAEQWTRLEVETPVRKNGQVVIRVDGTEVARSADVTPNCADPASLELLLGAQGTIDFATCMVSIDDVTLRVR